MVGRCHGDDITWKLIDLHQQKRHDAFDFAGLVIVTALFADRIKLIKEKNAGDRSRIVEQFCKSRVRLAQIRADKSIVSYREKLDRQALGNSFGDRRFAISRWSRQKDSVAWLYAVRPEEIGTVLLLYELLYLLCDRKRKNKVVQTQARRGFQNCIFAGLVRLS